MQKRRSEDKVRKNVFMDIQDTTKKIKKKIKNARKT